MSVRWLTELKVRGKIEPIAAAISLEYLKNAASNKEMSSLRK